MEKNQKDVKGNKTTAQSKEDKNKNMVSKKSTDNKSDDKKADLKKDGERKLTTTNSK